MEYIIIGLVVINMLLVLLVSKMLIDLKTQVNNQDEDQIPEIKALLLEENSKTIVKLIERFGDLKEHIQKELNENSSKSYKSFDDFKDGLNKKISESFESLNIKIETQMEKINQKVEMRLDEGFEKTNKTFTNIVERLSKIDEAQKNIEKLSTDVVSLQNVLTDKKSRGTFGEVQLNQILQSIFGDKEDHYSLQHTLSNGKMVDALLRIPDPMGDLAVDSKFPLENYQRMVDRDTSEELRKIATKKFKMDLKKHIDDIAVKYIIPNETSDQAVMFIPAEAIFAELNAYHQDIIDYAQSRRVWLASPTTLMSMLTTVQILLKNIERDKYAKEIQEELIKLGTEFSRYQKRWDTLSKSIDKVNSSVKDIHTTSSKIGRRFEEISHVQLDIEEKNID